MTVINLNYARVTEQTNLLMEDFDEGSRVLVPTDMGEQWGTVKGKGRFFLHVLVDGETRSRSVVPENVIYDAWDDTADLFDDAELFA